MRLFTSLVFVLSLLTTLTSQAQLVQTDWKGLNDNLAVLDTSTGNEWLSFRFATTSGRSWNYVNGGLPVTYSGWRFPTKAEMLTLLGNQFTTMTYVPSTQYYTGVVDPIKVTEWVNAFGFTFIDGVNSSLGFFDDAGVLKLAGVDFNQITLSEVGLGVNQRATGIALFGTYLIKGSQAPTPVPLTGTILGLGLLGLGIIKRKKTTVN